MIVSDAQVVSIRTASGIQLDQFTGGDIIDMTWTRERRETGRCAMNARPEIGHSRLATLIPWEHWVDVFNDNGDSLLWTGPIMKVAANRDTLSVQARDISTLLSRTRTPLTKRWEAADPADIAEEFWRAMIEHHNLNSRPIVRQDPLGDRFDFSSVRDVTMLESVMDDLVRQGLYWTVVAGTPILGPWTRKPVAALGEDDFVGAAIGLVRDGGATYNDILVRSADSKTYAVAPMGRQRLQQIVDIDSMFGVSNTDKVTYQYARHMAAVKDTITLDNGAVLHPDAPLSIDELVPSARITLTAFDMTFLMELTSVEVTTNEGTSSVNIGLEMVNDDLPELVEIQQKNAINGVG